MLIDLTKNALDIYRVWITDFIQELIRLFILFRMNGSSIECFFINGWELNKWVHRLLIFELLNVGCYLSAAHKCMRFDESIVFKE